VFFLALAVPLACLLIPGPVAAQRGGMAPASPHGSASESPSGVADLLIQLQDEKEAPYLEPAKVTLRNSKGDLKGTAIAEKGRAVFHSVPLDSYDVFVDVPGNPTVHASVSLQMAGEAHPLEVIVAGAASRSSGPPPPPPFTLREQKELTAGLRALQAQKLDEARKHFLLAAKTAPNHPDVDYLLGVLASMSGDVATAKQYFAAAAKNYQHVRSLTALGEIYLVEGNLDPAKTDLEAALHADPNNWRALQLLAAVELRRHSYIDAIRDAEQSLTLGKTEAKGARLTLGEAFASVGNYDRSDQVLRELLKQSPSQEQEKEVERLLEANGRALAPPSASEGAGSAYLPTGNAAMSLVALPLAASLPARADNPLTENPRWVPPNVDDAVPPVETGAACPVNQIVQEAGKRVLELATNLDRFTATERLSHQTLNEFGLAVRAEQLSFNYLVDIHEVKPGIFDVSEYRNGSDSREIFPEHVATLGTIATVFVFHPNYAGDFDFRCEGLAHQGDKPVWQVRFQQKPGQQSRIRSYRLGTQYFRVGIKGRAWVSADSFQVLRMESDLVGKVPEMRLNAEHQNILYGPVPFQKKDIVLWLPHSSETYLDFNGHRIHRRQDFTNYLLFWVEDRQRIEKPAETQADQPNAPNG
jgi:tetratricopeptide (TPR) repeat protein